MSVICGGKYVHVQTGQQLNLGMTVSCCLWPHLSVNDTILIFRFKGNPPQRNWLVEDNRTAHSWVTEILNREAEILAPTTSCRGFKWKQPEEGIFGSDTGHTAMVVWYHIHFLNNSQQYCASTGTSTLCISCKIPLCFAESLDLDIHNNQSQFTSVWAISKAIQK